MPPIQLVNAYWQGNAIVAVSRDSSGKRVRKAFPAEYCCFCLREDLKRLDLETKILDWGIVRGTRKEGDYLRISFRTWGDLKEATYRRKAPHPTQGGYETLFQRAHIPTFEADVYPTRRFLTDNEVEIQKPRRCFLDIETDSRVPFSQKEKARILTWAIYDDSGEWVGGILDENTDESERQLLVELWEELDRYDQIIAWNGDQFDFPVIRARTEYHEIAVTFAGWLWLDHLALFKRMNLQVSESGDEKQSFALGKIATQVLGETKDDLDASKTWKYWNSGDRDTLFEYNVRDAELLAKIEEKTGYVDLLLAICQVCATLPDSRGMDGTNYVEGYLMKLGATRGLRFPTLWRGDVEKGDPFEGAFVLEPTRKGVLSGIHVADFSGMYPSIIETWNLSPETLRRDVILKESPHGRPAYAMHQPLKEYPLPPDCCFVEGGNVFETTEVGILPLAVTELKRLRKHWASLKASLPPGTPEWKDADRRSMAYKVAANTFYGVIGAPMSRFFVREVASSVTAAGRWLIHQTMKAAEDRGMSTIYGDTDSIFVGDTTEPAFRTFVEWCNVSLYPKLLAAQGCKRNEISIAYEKEFDRIVLLRKKRYAGRFAHYKGTRATADSKPEIKGLEFKRGDSVRLARELQHAVVMALLYSDFPVSWYRDLATEWRDRVLTGSLDVRDFVMSKTLSKGIGEYAQKAKKDGTLGSRPTHVEVAAILSERGLQATEGTRIEYVVVDGSVTPLRAIPACDYSPGDEDRFYLWETLIFPATHRVLEVAFPGEDWKPFERVRPPKPRAVRAKATPSKPAAPRSKPKKPTAQTDLF